MQVQISQQSVNNVQSQPFPILSVKTQLETNNPLIRNVLILTCHADLSYLEGVKLQLAKKFSSNLILTPPPFHFLLVCLSFVSIQHLLL